MKFRKFLKEKFIYIIVLSFILISTEIFLSMYDIDNWVMLYIPITIIVGFLICLIIEYNIKNSYYKDMYNKLKELEEKYLITEVIKEPSFIEGKILKDTLADAEKSMIENVNKYKYLTEDYKDYIELWIHEIKIPIAASKMIIENNKSKQMKSIDEELEKIENYIEQALFYARSNTVEKDYYISKTNLTNIINNTIIKNKNILISNNINVEIEHTDYEVFTDGKWIIFILNQVIQNSIKYMNKETKTIKIRAKEEKEKVTLFIEDNGIGVKQSEISRVFEKGFTGSNGRIIGKKSTGIGLYLCKKLCDKLGLAIEFDSKVEKGSTVKIIFPKNSYVNL